jgi:hypothetical protein
LGITFACNKGVGGSEVDFIVNDQAVSFTVEDTGSWSTFISKKIGRLNLPKAGTFTMEVIPRKKPKFAVMNLHNVILNPAQ